MFHTVELWIAHYGYGAIFLLLMLGVVGLPVPDETLLVYCVVSPISKGVMHPVAAFFTAMVGSWCGISLQLHRSDAQPDSAW